MTVKIRWLGVACLEIESPEGDRILIDPFLDEAITAREIQIKEKDIERADVIVISHGHWDHFMDVPSIMKRCNSKLVCTQIVADMANETFGLDKNQIMPVAPGDKLQFPNFDINIVKGVHISIDALYEALLGKKPDMPTEEMFKSIVEYFFDDPAEIEKYLEWNRVYQGGEQLNFIFEFSHGMRIYFYGSIKHPDLENIQKQAKADVLLLQVLPTCEKDAGEVALRSKPALVIPIHFDLLFPGQKTPDLSILKKEIESYLNKRLA